MTTTSCERRSPRGVYPRTDADDTAYARGQRLAMTRSRARIEIPCEQLADFCRRHHVRRLALFGSVLRDDFTSSSDIDVLIEFKPGMTPGFAFVTVQEELARLLDRCVDLRTPNELSKYFREEVLAEAEELYVEAG